MSRRRVLAGVLAGCLVLNAVLIVGLRTPWPDTVLQPIYWFLSARQGGDSWRGMLRAHGIAATAEGRGALYEQAFFSPTVQHNGFQYPPTALLVVSGLDAVAGAATESALRTITWIAVPLTALFVFWIAGGERRGAPAGLAVAFAATLAFYPVMRAYRNGQIQTWLTLTFAASLLAFVSGRPATSGVLAGLSCLVKPQWSLILLWAGLRREWRFAGGFVAAVVTGLVLALPLYGVAPFVDYVGVLRFLARHGEAFFPNQSVNGLLNRLLFNGDNLTWHPQWIAHFPPFHPVVYAGTLVTSALILAIALFGARARAIDRPLDYALMALAGTMASPIAWEHHYGVLLPIFALLLHRWDAGRLSVGHAAVIAGAFVLAGTHVHAANRLAATRWNVLQSLLFFSALAVFAVLARVRR